MGMEIFGMTDFINPYYLMFCNYQKR